MRLRNPRVQGALRHLLTSAGPVLVMLNGREDWSALLDGWTAIVGLIMAAIGFWASWTAPEKRAAQ